MRAILVAAVASSIAAFAQQSKKSVQPAAKEIACSLDDDLIVTYTDQPDVELRHCDATSRRRLIQVPTEFKDKALDSARDL
jgi:hypothetical protein